MGAVDEIENVHDMIVVGAGFSGLYMVHQAREELGLDVVGIEAGSGPGGTWYWNRYPGARCDSESFYYCYTFSRVLLDEWDWSARYPEQPEILRYLEFAADRLDLRRSFAFDTRVESMTWDDHTARWIVRTDTGRTLAATYVVTAVGCLSAANVPSVPGLEDFGGDWFHTGRWPHEGVDFAGRRVAQIGTGSTGIQAAPVIARDAEHLYVFQRTPNYTVPARDRPMGRDEWIQIKSRYDETVRATKESFAGFPYTPSSRSALELSAEERTAVYEALWEEGGFKFLWGGFFDLLLDERANETAAEFIRSKIRSIVHDPEVAEQLCPKGYPYGAKRPPIDTDYYETFNRENVTLVDISDGGVTRITATGVETAHGHYDVDTVVFATGFDAMTGPLLRMNITGSDGLTLAEKWADGPATYLGLQVAGFPNLFTITGPGSPSVLTNMPTSIEQHVEWIAACIRDLRERGQQTIEPTQEAADAWTDHVAEASQFGLFNRADSWYLGANIPGKKRIFMPYVGGLANYRAKCEEIAASGYDGFLVSPVPTA
ncbi:MAG TPA: NAD(P)/FAD-dependent oxidoreductase [Acidimicrobiales bacterium]|nr:NAD(P)/FAD-dependent oxidoreductase [Acidimicrobiales bacterium]